MQLPLEQGKFYHVFNRGNNREKIFFKEENYRYFLQIFDQCLSNHVETYAYCLLPNHFHFLIRVIDTPKINPNDILVQLTSTSEQFRKFFIKYSQAINLQEGRSGSLFQKPFKRKEITSEDYLTRVIFYIHSNPQKHGLIKDFKQYQYSSFSKIMNPASSKLMKGDVIKWFGSKEEYWNFHCSMQNLELEHSFGE